MIDIDYLKKIVEEEIAKKEIFLVSADISSDSSITVKVDSMAGVSIKECVELSRFIENNFDREDNDYQLQVTSPGLDQPFHVLEQYKKNIGKEIEILLSDGKKLNGALISATDIEIEIVEEKRIKLEGKKRKELVKEQKTIKYKDMKSAKLKIMFK
ncbi:MAG: ribosome assembly cofactor RimP [Bacteroidetes bacterium]|jgi:ribosome maturation factor RimP|nr:ribosome assembly cofactor RimP [Bacteroidota bacterium]MBT6687879.1 ribosome assembly cofactor RimP [Bacteroidota bacterium]MBT7142473.1 ribosome assembly cofactor RimP [Bacteroidota bacterium]MBT7490020.1 ribosome assembly cofactor RimP [Bacteroidota bacterium]